jgi:AcrR family transcriptional regulator
MIRKLDPDRRVKFLSAALELFVANGVQHTSTAEIARAAGSAAGTLFLYFPTKQDLIDELVLKISREQSDTIKSILSPAFSARETFFTIWSGSLRWFLENPSAFRYIQQVRDTRLISEATVRESNRFFDYYYAAIQKGLEEGSLKPYPLEMIGGFLYQDIVAMMHILMAQADPNRQEETLRMGFKIFWDGVRVVSDTQAGGKQDEI